MGEPLPPVVRIPNTGNSCYMNAALQFLFSVPQVLDRLADTDEAHFILDHLSEDEYFMDELFSLAKRFDGQMDTNGPHTSPRFVADPHCLAIDIKNFKKQANKDHPDFSKSGMEDALEYLLYLVTLITEKYKQAWQHFWKTCHCVTPLDSFPRKDPCEEGFRIMLKEIVNRQGNYTVTDRVEYVLSVPIPDNYGISSAHGGSSRDITSQRTQGQGLLQLIKAQLPNTRGEPNIQHKGLDLENCLAAFFAVERIVNAENRLVHKTSHIDTFPPCVVIQVRRFAIDHRGKAIKLGTRVEAPRKIDLGKWSFRTRVEKRDAQKEEYTLRAFVEHQSRILTTSSGHYVTYVLHSELNEWYMYDDSRIRRLDNAPTDQGYFYLYQKCQSAQER